MTIQTNGDELERERFHEWATNQCSYDMAFADQTRRTYRSFTTRRALKVWLAALSSKQEEA